jgi:hypothetical protein
MGLELTITFAIITFIIVLAVLVVYFSKQDQLLPPYQEPVAKEDISWPFPQDKP